MVSGPAAALVAWLWRRGDDSEIAVSGDPATYDEFRRRGEPPDQLTSVKARNCAEGGVKPPGSTLVQP